ncbi:MAG: phosphoesterase PA-phosphatase, partial [Butyrivibrio sp.]|nr:phosphoesterase PA-phosphatase [Butyrivibrio sp.]
MKNTDTKRKEFLWIAGGSTLLFLLLILLVRTVDVAAIGPEGTSIGLSHLNRAVHEAFVYRPFWYALTEYLWYVALLVAAGFAGMGLLQLIRRRSLRKVDRPILALGV